MRRFTLALFLSFILHAALLALLQGSGTEAVPRETRKMMRVSLAESQGEKRDGNSPINSEVPVPSQPERIAVPQPAPLPPPARQVRTPPPRPNTAQAKPKEPLPKNEPRQTAEKSEPSSTQSANVRQSNAQQSNAPASMPNAGAGQGAVIDASQLRVVKKVSAEYPMISRRRKDQGTVVLVLNIRSGRVAKAEIEKSSGHSALDESAKKAVSAWVFDTSGFGESLSARISFVFSLTN